MDAYKNTRGYCTNYTIDGSVLLVNTDMLKELGIEVNGYADLLQPELVGKIASADPGFFFLRVLPAHQHAARHGRL